MLRIIADCIERSPRSIEDRIPGRLARDLYEGTHTVRCSLHLLALIGLGLGLAPACVDAPITTDQLEADGMLREVGTAREQAAFSVRAAPQRSASVVQLSAVLATESAGALTDRDRFEAAVGVIHLHVRADGIDSPKAVTFRWIHGDQAIVTPGTLGPAGALELASSVEVAPHQIGPWRVEVAAQTSADAPPEVLFVRHFAVD